MIKDGKWGIKFLTLEFDELRVNQVEVCNNWKCVTETYFGNQLGDDDIDYIDAYVHSNSS